MMKVYILHYRDWNEGWINGVFSTLVEAETAKKFRQDNPDLFYYHGGFNIEEWEIEKTEGWITRIKGKEKVDRDG